MMTPTKAVRALAFALVFPGLIYLKTSAAWCLSAVSSRHSFAANQHPARRRFLLMTRHIIPSRLHYSTASSSSDVLFDIGFTTQAGSDPDRYKTNQDAFFVHNTTLVADGDNEDDWILLGVMDGHGTKGHLLTEYLQAQLPRRILQQLRSVKQPDSIMTVSEEREQLEKYKSDLIRLGRLENATTRSGESSDGSSMSMDSILTDAFYLAQLDAMREPNIPAQRSGTTCVVAAIQKRVTDNDDDKMIHLEIHLAHVGDSKALWQTRDEEGNCMIRSTYTTTTKDPSERERMERAEGRIDNMGNVFYGPQGIAMTRSLGNAFMIRAGVVPTPVIQRLQSNPQSWCEWLVLATDGVWDVLSQQRVQEIIQESHSLQSAVEQIATESRVAWQEGLSMEVKIDDITCVAIRLTTS
jgi:serine/threonine protein phosphatase PrpC